jgi:hypothetical protein
MTLSSDISNWIKEEANKRGGGHLVVNARSPYSSELATVVTIFLCKHTMLATTVLASTNDILDWCQKLNVSTIQNEKSSLTTLHSLSQSSDAIIVGARTKTESHLIRHYDKFEPVDILPLVNLKLEQVRALYLEFRKFFTQLPALSGSDVFLEAPFKPQGFAEDSLEWLNELNSHSKIIESDNDPAKEHSWFQYTIKQKELIAKVHQIEKMTRHKYNPALPAFKL